MVPWSDRQGKRIYSPLLKKPEMSSLAFLLAKIYDLITFHYGGFVSFACGETASNLHKGDRGEPEFT